MDSDVASHWGTLASSYNDRMNLYCQERFVQIIQPYIKGNVLDLGCGTGFIQDMLGTPSLGIDLTLGLLKVNKNPVVCGNAQILPFKNNTFDMVYSVNLLEHVPNPHLVISECKRVLKKNGILIIITPNKEMELILDLAEKLHLKLPEGPHRFLTANDLNTLTFQNHLKKISSGKIVIFPKKLKIISDMFERLENYLQPFCLLQYTVVQK